MSEVKEFFIETFPGNMETVVLKSDYTAKEAECKNLINRNEYLVEELGSLGELNSEHIKEINKLTAINKTLLDACETFFNKVGKAGYIDIVKEYNIFKSAIQEARKV